MRKLVIGCELCGSPAQIYCNSDRAWLCWQCDARVHGANFLVAKHKRAVLCHQCQAPTSWAGSGPRLVPRLSFCLSHSSPLQPTSVQLQAQNQAQQDHDHNVSDMEFTTDDDESCVNDDDDDEDDQVVPWSTSSEISGCEAEDCNVNSGLLKRKRDIDSLYSC